MALTPTMYLPSGVRRNMPLNCVMIRVLLGKSASDGGVGGGGTTCSAVTCDPVGSVGSNSSSVLVRLPVPEPSVQISTRPSGPTSTPCGLAGSEIVFTTG